MSISSIGTAGSPFSSNYGSGILTPRFDPARPMSPELKARVAEATRRSEELTTKSAEMEARSKLETVEVNNRNAPNVITLTKDQALRQITYMSELIQSGESEKTKLYTGYGDKLTNNYRQYVYWLQQHVEELEGAGQSTLAQAETAPAAAPDAAAQHSGWKRITESVKYEDLSPEQKARWALDDARVAEADRIAAEMEVRSKLETVENNVFYAPNVSTLGRNSARQLILHMSELIQSGVAEKTPLQTGYGDKTTDNYGQYIDWLQQHVKELDAAGQSAPGQTGTGTAGGPFPADYVSEIKRLRTDVPGVNYEDWSPEFKARVAEGRRRSEEGLRIAKEMEERSKLETVENNSYCAPYVKGLSREQALTHLYFASEVIRNGQEEKYTLSTSLDGKQTTSNFRQYVYWLQQHVKELEGAGQSTLARV